MKIFSRAKALLLPLVALLAANAAYAFQDCELTPEQEGVLHFSYSYGEPHDYGYTMAAIAMEESNLGKWRLNLQDPSASAWGVTIDKAVTKLGWDHTPFNYNRAAQKLVDDIYFGAALALETILWWDKTREGNWRRVVESYNAGYGSNPEYVRRIIGHIDTIKECNWLKEDLVFTVSGQCIEIEADKIVHYDMDTYKFIKILPDGSKKTVAAFNNSKIEGWTLQ